GPLARRVGAALAVEPGRPQVVGAEAELLVLGAGAPGPARLFAVGQHRGQLVATDDRGIACVAGAGHANRSVGHVPRHAGGRSALWGEAGRRGIPALERRRATGARGLGARRWVDAYEFIAPRIPLRRSGR